MPPPLTNREILDRVTQFRDSKDDIVIGEAVDKGWFATTWSRGGVTIRLNEALTISVYHCISPIDWCLYHFFDAKTASAYDLKEHAEAVAWLVAQMDVPTWAAYISDALRSGRNAEFEVLQKGGLPIVRWSDNWGTKYVFQPRAVNVISHERPFPPISLASWQVTVAISVLRTICDDRMARITATLNDLNASHL